MLERGVENKRFISELNRKKYQNERERDKFYNMSETKQNSEFYGLEVSEFAAIPLKGTILTNEDKPKYTPASSHLVSYSLQHSQPIPSLKNARKTERKNKLDKRKLNKHKIMSPEEVMMKCARQAYERELAASMQGKEAVAKKIYPALEKKKKSQQKRRLERVILIKAYKWQLFVTFRQQVFKRRWQISRQELIETLGLVPENIDFEYLTNLIVNRKRTPLARHYVSDHRMGRFIYNNPFTTLMRKNEVEYERKVMNREKEKNRKIEGEHYKKKARRVMRRQRLYEEPKEKVSKMEFAKKANATVFEDHLLKRIQLDENSCDTIDTEALEKEFPSLLSNS